MTSPLAVSMPQTVTGPASAHGAKCSTCDPHPATLAAPNKAYCPDPSVIATTNLNLSRLGPPARDLRSSLLHKQDSFSSIAKFTRGDSSHSSLSHQPSKLDLIDDTTLTSLPLPPPLKPKSRGSGSGSGSGSSSLPGDNEPPTPALDLKPLLSSITMCNGAEAEVDETFESELFEDDEDDDHHDPIVLIEDYMAKQKARPNHNETPACNNTISPRISTGIQDLSISGINSIPDFNDDDELTLINKKRSLATFKQRILNNSLHLSKSVQELGHDLDSLSDVSTFTSTCNGDTLNNILASNHTHFNSSTSLLHSKPKNKRTFSNDFVSRPLLNYSKSENLEEIFGKIPGSDLLKHCELCEKPLYEISSIINNNKKLKKSKNRTSAEDSNKVNQVYNEFICGECVETYEEFFNELYQDQMTSPQSSSNGLSKESTTVDHPMESCASESTKVDSMKNEKLLTIFQSIQNKYDKKQQMGNIASKRSFYHKTPTYKRISRAPFSENLMSRLNYLNSLPEGYTYSNESENKSPGAGFGLGFGIKPNNPKNGAPIQTGTSKKTIDLDWIRSLQSKLRWTWGFNGLARRNSLESDR
ncbi:uncharacterized protein CANTADRAFT_91544 [Suhomyces tanzawaensis NRRL Y-17324]|uniref:Uncharacterized protein n=1 Tax=Suhomyces tanzawaensis NRRL Y-17324 TaxID=984487 RepID=A0A1E4SF46_9ASCO|nr:uncharacterized protein CANTADRAFT_91544 [Suhomyces tanzawaensis NRRL Y-17324]ODV78113.1 hypothetical protein CANTADRAFT_91544 [Suhomyces tanzawaensis NRRL Y-17324]